MQVYQFRQDVHRWILLEGKIQKYLANEIGTSELYLSRVLSGKRLCSRTFAYALTKCVSRDKKVEDLFIRKEK